MDFRLLSRAGGLQKIEIAAAIGLPDVLREHRTIAPREARFRRQPLRFAFGEFDVVDMEMDAPRRNVYLDQIAGLDESERPPGETFRRDM